MKKLVGRFHGVLHLSAKRHRSIICWEDAHMRDVLGNHSKDRSFRLVRWLNITLSLRRISQESINFGKKLFPGLFLGYALYAGRIWKGDILVADIEELETMDASEIYARRLNAKEVIFPKENGNFIFPVAAG